MTRQTIRYSQAFKLKVVKEIESGKYTIGDARRIYDINGAETIQKWIRKMGKSHLIKDIIRVQMKDEKDKIKKLQNRIKVLERALNQAQVDNICWQSLIEVIDEKYGIDSKKNFGPKLPPELQDILKKLP
jgi:transposase